MSKEAKKKKDQPKVIDPALIKAAQMLVREDVDLSILPDSKLKTEFFELADLAVKGKIRSLQKVRLEYLCGKMAEYYDNVKNREMIEKRKKEAEALREKREKTRKMLRKKTKKGQPVLRNLAKVQLMQIQEMLEKENQAN